MGRLTARSNFDHSGVLRTPQFTAQNGALKTRGWNAANQWAHGCRRVFTQGNVHLRVLIYSLQMCLLFRQIMHTCGCCTGGEQNISEI